MKKLLLALLLVLCSINNCKNIRILFVDGSRLIEIVKYKLLFDELNKLLDGSGMDKEQCKRFEIATKEKEAIGALFQLTATNIAKHKRATMLLSKSQVFYSNPKNDITDEVLKEINSRLK